ncbi:hypothetical protein Y032_0036g3336 [Ancylostoma ceylanicum]|uniref:Uncharacterized protein n=1 Tax=Ancylostoma ceylanicum TaxID=53326 RepID=A0A016ULL5_9BILA|nr:hypothetical protein Y032_0036g3336 [Ancylostoma ceylanicum]
MSLLWVKGKKNREEATQYGSVGSAVENKTREEKTQYGNVDFTKQQKTREEKTQYGNVDIGNQKKTREEKTQYGEIITARKPSTERKGSSERIDQRDSPSVRKKRSKRRKDQSAETCLQTGGHVTSSKRKPRSKKDKHCDSTQDETPKRRKPSRGSHHSSDDSPRKRRSRSRDGAMERTAIGKTVMAQCCVEDDAKNTKGKLMVAEMRSRRSKRNASLRKKKTKTYGATEMTAISTPTTTPEGDQMKTVIAPSTTPQGAVTTPTNGAEPPKDEKVITRISPSKSLTPGTGQEPPSVRQTSIRIRLSRALSTAATKVQTSTTTTTKADGPKEERSIRQTSIRERLKRGLKSALSAFSRASLEKSFQSAKARMMAPKRTSSLYDYQDSYMGGAMDQDDDEDEDDDVDFYNDMTHRPDLVLVRGNNTNNGQIFNEKGQPFWKDKKFLVEIPRPTRLPMSTLLLMLSERKMALKDSVAAPTHLDAMELELQEMQCRDRKHFSDDLLLSNTIRSIISTLDDIDEYSKNKPVDIQKLKVLEPKTAREYSRHYPENNEEVAFVYSGLGVCKTKKSKSNSASLSTGSASSSSSSTERSSKRKKKKKDSNRTEIKEERSARKRRTKKKDI